MNGAVNICAILDDLPILDILDCFILDCAILDCFANMIIFLWNLSQLVFLHSAGSSLKKGLSASTFFLQPIANQTFFLVPSICFPLFLFILFSKFTCSDPVFWLHSPFFLEFFSLESSFTFSCSERRIISAELSVLPVAWCCESRPGELQSNNFQKNLRPYLLRT